MGRKNEENRENNLNTLEYFAVTHPPEDNLCAFCAHVLPPIKSQGMVFHRNDNGHCMMFKDEPKPDSVLWEQSAYCEKFEIADDADIEDYARFIDEHATVEDMENMEE